MNLTLIAILGIVILLVLLFAGMDIGMAMLSVGFIGYVIINSFGSALGLLKSSPATVASNYSFCVIPLFILMGNFAFASGLSGGLYDVGHKWLNRLPGGLACATIAACAGFGAICGSVPATAATMSVVAIPEMRKYNYDDSLSSGAVAVGSTLGIMIPPSTAFIMYGIMAEESIGKLFMAGVFPGILLAILCIISIVIIVMRNPSLAPKSGKVTWGERLKSLKGLIRVVILFGIVFGGMGTGIFTINEAAAAGAFVGLVIYIVSGKFTWKGFGSVMYDSIKTIAMTYLILIGADVFSKFLSISNLPTNLAAFVGGLAVSKYVILVFILVIYAILGCFMDAMAMILLTVPIFLPIIKTLGFDPIWFGVMIVLVMELGLVTPPVGLACYVVKGTAKDVPLQKVFKGCFPLIPAILVAMVLVIVFPELATWLAGVSG